MAMIKGVREIHSLEERAMVLRAMGEGDALEFVGRRVDSQTELEWIVAAVEFGAFDLDETLDPEAAKTSVATVQAIVGSLNRFYFKLLGFDDVSVDPEIGPLNDYIQVAEMRVCDEFRELYAATATRFAERWAQLSEGANSTYGGVSAASVQSLATNLMAGAAALDLPEVVRALLSRWPEAGVLGADPGAFSSCLGFDAAASPTPYGVALSVSSVRCMDVLHDSFECAETPLILRGDGAEPVYLESLKDDRLRFTLPSAHLRALRQRLRAAPDALALLRQRAEAALDGGVAGLAMRAHIPAYLQAGLYDVDPSGSIRLAIEHGHPEVVQHFTGRLPWEGLLLEGATSSPINLCVERSSKMGDRFERSLLALFNEAEEDGMTDLVMRQFPQRVRSAEHLIGAAPMQKIIEKGFLRVLHKMLMLGLDPSAPAVVGGLTPLEMAEALGAPAAVALMRGHAAKRAANATMDLTPVLAPLP